MTERAVISDPEQSGGVGGGGGRERLQESQQRGVLITRRTGFLRETGGDELRELEV